MERRCSHLVPTRVYFGVRRKTEVYINIYDEKRRFLSRLYQDYNPRIPHQDPALFEPARVDRISSHRLRRVCVCVCVLERECVCLCVREKGREKERVDGVPAARDEEARRPTSQHTVQDKRKREQARERAVCNPQIARQDPAILQPARVDRSSSHRLRGG